MASRDTAYGALLPTVKCSDCGSQIQISLMGEHVCNAVLEEFPPLPEPPLPPQNIEVPVYNGSDKNAGGFLKPGRPGPPPRIDPSLANRPFLRPNDIVPIKGRSHPQSLTPLTPSSDTRRSYRQTQRSMLSPRPPSPPSPEFANLDCAFPPFPTASSRSGTPVSDTRGLMAALNGELKAPKSSSSSRPSSRAASFSRSRGQSISSPGVRSRSTTLASNSDPIPRPATAGSNRRRPSVASNMSSAAKADDELPPIPALPFLGPQIRSLLGNAAEGDTVRSRESENDRGSRPERVGGYGGLGQEVSPYAQMNPYAVSPQNIVDSPAVEEKPQTPLSEALREPQLPNTGTGNDKKGSMRRPPPLADAEFESRSRTVELPAPSPTRSQTFPLRNESRATNDGPNRRPSEPSPARPRRPTMSTKNSLPPSEIPSGNGYQPYRPSGVPAQSSGRYPPRNSSRPTSTRAVTYDSAIAPTIYGSNFADDLDIGNPYHNTSDSASSNGSEVSTAPTDASLGYSPPRRGDTAHAKELSDEIPPVPPVPTISWTPGADSPTDTLFQKGRLSPMPRVPPTPPVMLRQSTDPIRRPPTRSGTTKGTCRGCSNLIMANEKSVSSADGRLTGRYHKACFVCHDCRSPFATADFYVLNNSPYCAKHYHEANGSLCSCCGDGIEGQFLEADTGNAGGKATGPNKFHPACFTCDTCKVMLNEDFFVFGGRIFCERDAFVAAGLSTQRQSPNGQHTRANSRNGPSRAATINRANGLLAPGMGMPAGGLMPGGGRRFPERRTTKLMNMI